jgi:hypothetical protein
MKKHIPKNKYDVEAVRFLNSCLLDNIKPDIPELLVWMQDLHWEVAHGIGSYLALYVNDIKTDLIKILNSNDEFWKKGILFGLIGKHTQELDEELASVIKRIAETPTNSEREEEVDIFAKEVVFPCLRKCTNG